MNRLFKQVGFAAVIALLVMTPASIFASSHMDAPLIVRDPSANTTDVYAFVDQESNGQKSLVVALGVYPHQEPGIGPNKYNFDDNVRYEIHVVLGRDTLLQVALLIRTDSNSRPTSRTSIRFFNRILV